METGSITRGRSADNIGEQRHLAEQMCETADEISAVLIAPIESVNRERATAAAPKKKVAPSKRSKSTP